MIDPGRDKPLREDEWPDEHDLVDADEPAEVRCPSCGAEVFEDCQKCPHCGEWIVAAARAGRGGRGRLWLIAAIVLIVVILVVWVMRP